MIKGHVDLLFANEAELLSLYETSDFDSAIESLRKDGATAAVTRSEKGSVVITPDEIISMPAEPVRKVVDATGAGDQYAAGFSWLCPQPPYARLRQARPHRCSRVISHYGPRPETSYRQLAVKVGRQIHFAVRASSTKSSLS